MQPLALFFKGRTEPFSELSEAKSPLWGERDLNKLLKNITNSIYKDIDYEQNHWNKLMRYKGKAPYCPH
jgi:hypothetical protein